MKTKKKPKIKKWSALDVYGVDKQSKKGKIGFSWGKSTYDHLGKW